MKIIPRFASCMEALLTMGASHVLCLVLVQMLTGLFLLYRLLMRGYFRVIFSSR